MGKPTPFQEFRGCKWVLSWLVLGMVGATGCAGYSSSFTRIEQYLASDQPAAALATLEEDAPVGRDKLLYHLERAMLLRCSGRLEESNGEFERAKRLAVGLAALSLREQGTALLFNDTATSYAGAAFELVLIHLYAALNYLEMGDPDAARVEVLQVDLQLRELAEGDPDSFLSSDPFARYLSGMIYEDGGEWSDAMIAYRKAYQAYREHGEHYAIDVPAALQEDLVRAAIRVGLEDEAERYRVEFGLEQWPETYGGRGRGELVLLFHNGLVPVKRERSITVPVAGKGYLVRIAVPEYQRRPVGAGGVRVETGGLRALSEPVENIGGIAVADLAAHMPGIVARTAARATAKYVAAYLAGKDNEWAGLLVNLAGVITERVDTRSWLTLPDEIQMARISLPPGKYDVEVAVIGPRGDVVDHRQLSAVEVARSRRVYRSLHWVSLRSVMRH